LAAAVLIGIWRYTGRQATSRRAPLRESEPTAAPARPGDVLAEETAAPATPLLPTPGPRAAADAVVGAPRSVGQADVVRPAPTKAPSDAPEPATQRSESRAVSEAETSGGDEPAGNLYRTRESARFTLSPDQARVYVDGRYIGVADDWDDRGGGREFAFERPGRHRVRVELPGYRTVHLDVFVSPSAEDESIEIDDDLDRISKVDYPKLASVTGRTTGPVEFTVDPPEASVSEGGRVLGPASAFGPTSPLRLSGPTVHDLVLSAPGRRPKTVRILVAPNAGRERARIKATLKPK
jgi:hypothetical protein